MEYEQHYLLFVKKSKKKKKKKGESLKRRLDVLRPRRSGVRVTEGGAMEIFIPWSPSGLRAAVAYFEIEKF